MGPGRTLLVALFALLWACTPPAPDAGRGEGLLVIAVDGLRRDRVSAYGYDRPTTPVLDGLAQEGVLFEQAFAAAPELFPAHAALLTGCDPNVARRILQGEFEAVVEQRWSLPDRVPRLGVEFLANGWHTGLFVDHEQLAPIFGVARGFQRFVTSSDLEEKGCRALARQVVQWVRGLGRDEPWFAYVELQDLERHWKTPDPEALEFFEERAGSSEVPPVAASDGAFFAIPRSRWSGAARTLARYQAQYDGHVRKLDQSIGELLGSLEALGRSRQTTVVVVGSFGVQFGEAGLYLRAGRYSLADLSVPLILRPSALLAASGIQPATRTASLASVIDLAPTLLELHGLSIPAGTHGKSHADELRGRPAGAPPRRFAVASCGLQEGCAVIGERHVLEYLFATDVAGSAGVRSWYGDGGPQTREPRGRFYDRFASPFPPLDQRIAGGQDMILEEYRAHAARWAQTMELLRRALQEGGLFASSLDAQDEAELVRTGYLAEDP